MSNPTNEDLCERARYGSLYYTIPSAVFDDTRLTGEEILFYILIANLANKFGYCYASDEWFAQKRKVDDRTIRRWLENLEKFAYIKRDTKKIGMKWERKIFVLPVNHQQDSNNVYERTNESFSRGHTSGQICPDRPVKNVRIIEKEINKETTTTPTRSLSSKEQKKKLLLSKFGECLTDSIFDKSWKELMSMDPFTITSVDGVLSKIIEKYLLYKEKHFTAVVDVEDRDNRIFRHKKQCEGHSSDVFKPSATCVYVKTIDGSYPISYDCEESEWIEQTKNWLKHAN